MTTYARIKNLSDTRNITISALEKELDLSNGSIAKWTTTVPKADTLYKVAKYFNTTIEYLLTNENTSPVAISTGAISNSNANVIGNNHAPIIQSPIPINDSIKELTEQEQEILRIYNLLSAKEKAQLFLDVCKYDKE